MTPDPVSGILFRQPLISFAVLSLVLSAQHVFFIPTLILNLSWSLSWTCLVLTHAVGNALVPAVGNALTTSFARAHPCGWVCSFHSFHHIDRKLIGFLTRQTCRLTSCLVSSSETLIGAAVDCSLFWTCVRSPASPRERRLTLPRSGEALVASRA